MPALRQPDRTRTLSTGTEPRGSIRKGAGLTQPNPVWQSLALRPLAIQSKLAVSRPDDPYEQEADRVANQVTSAPTPSLQRVCDCGGACGQCGTGASEDEGVRLQPLRNGGGEAAPADAPPAVSEVLRSSGRPLDNVTRSHMESRFGYDFGSVRVHTDAKAAESARSVNALAYTVGRDVVFGNGQFSPDSASGQRLLAHELVHTIQQSNGLNGFGESRPVGLARSISKATSSNLLQRAADCPTDKPVDPDTLGPLFVKNKSDVEKLGLKKHTVKPRVEGLPYVLFSPHCEAGKVPLKGLVDGSDAYLISSGKIYKQVWARQEGKSADKTYWGWVNPRLIEAIAAPPAATPAVTGTPKTEPSQAVGPVKGDIRQQTVTPQWLAGLTDAELQHQANIATDELQRLSPGTPEHQALAANLSMLEEEAALRGVDLPAVTAYALESVIRSLGADLSEMQAKAKSTREIQINAAGTKFSDVFGKLMDWGDGELSWAIDALAEALTLVAEGRAAGPQANSKFAQAGTRYSAALFGAQGIGIWLAFVQTAATGLEYAVPISLEFLLKRLYDVRDKIDPLMKELHSLDAQRVESAASQFTGLAKGFDSDYKALVDAFDRAAENYQKLMKFVAVYELVIGAIGGFRMSGGRGGGTAAVPVMLRLPGIGGISGGAATGISIAISTEWLEMIRRLAMTGAISVGMSTSVVGLAHPGQSPSAFGLPTMLRVPTPTGTVQPSAGSYKGKSVKFEDGRHKHTKFANHSVDELEQAMRKPPNKGALSNFARAKGDETFGGQLGKEAVAQYGKLILDALEKGIERAGKFYYEASFDVGIDIMTGKRTRFIRVDGAPTGAHIIPVSSIPK